MPTAKDATLPAPLTVKLSDLFSSFEAALPDQKAALAAIMGWTWETAQGRPSGLVLWSEGYGRGKTHLALCADRALAYERPSVRGVFYTAPDWLEQIRKTYNHDTRETEYDLFRAWSSGYFILDDWGKQYSREQEWEQEKLFKLLDKMIERQSLLLTSNLNPEKLEKSMSGAAWSRLVGMCGPSGFVNMSRIPDYRLRTAVNK